VIAPPRVRKAVIPAAGLGTRFLPVTKSTPKEMLPVVDRPAIQYVVEEAVEAGITDVLIVTGRNKSTIEDHFDRSVELEQALERTGKHDALKEVRRAAELADVHFVRQRDPLGLGHAVSVARRHVGDEPFVVLLPDDIMNDDGALLRAMLDLHARRGASVIGLEEVPAAEISAYGCVDPGDSPDAGTDGDDVVAVRRVVEKPAVDEAPSNLAIIGRYVLAPEIFTMLDRIEPGSGGELQLTDAIALLLAEQPVFGCVSRGARFDVGRKLDWLRANVELALGRPDLGSPLRDWLRTLSAGRGPGV
jgi:UTP--glucose-1-phosphate uridylyltransferase